MRVSTIRRLIRERKQELVELTARLVQVPTENPGADLEERSAEVGSLIKEYLVDKGLQVTEYVGVAGLTSVVADVSLSDVPGPRLLYGGHTDVVPAGDRERWSFEPYSGDIQNGKILGRGASDMKGGLAAQVFVAGLLQEMAPSLNLKGSLSVFAVPDEESGGDNTEMLLEQGILHGDACLLGEPTLPHHPVIGEKGGAWMRVTVHGEPGHARLQPIAGGSAVRLGAQVVEALDQLWEMQAQPPAELTKLLHQSEYTTWQEGAPEYAQLLYRPSYNPGVIRGGTNVNSVAEECVIEVDSRIPYGMTAEEVLSRTREIVETIAPGAIIEPFGIFGDPNWTREDRPVVKALEEGIEQVLGTEEPTFSVLMIGSSDARYFRKHGIDTALYGPGELDTIHGYDESVAIADLVNAAEVYAETAIAFLR